MRAYAGTRPHTHTPRRQDAKTPTALAEHALCFGDAVLPPVSQPPQRVARLLPQRVVLCQCGEHEAGVIVAVAVLLAHSGRRACRRGTGDRGSCARQLPPRPIGLVPAAGGQHSVHEFAEALVRGQDDHGAARLHHHLLRVQLPDGNARVAVEAVKD